MDIQADVNKTRQAMKLLWEVANDTQSNVFCNAVVVDPKEKEALWPDPFITTDINAWHFDFSEDHGFSLNFNPTEVTSKEYANADWKNDVDPEQIVSFNEPPIEKAPSTDQSKTGQSQKDHSLLYAEMEDISSHL